MSTPAAMFGPAALTDLESRTEYEAWLLEAVYDITDQRIAVEDVDELVYEPSGAPPRQTIYGVGGINISDWRPGFLRAGAPLVFVTEFKLLDMLMEWVLAENPTPPTSSFAEKRKALKGVVQFPLLISRRGWLQERLLALYSRLEPFRGTIVHERHFRSTDGSLEVSSSRGPTRVIVLSAADPRSLAVVLV
jgi:hypothetical protein